MSFPALLDTNVLFSATLSDTLLRCAEEELFHPLWSRDILQELQRVLIREAGLPADKAQRLISRMQAAFPTAQVDGYENMIQAMSCDANDQLDLYPDRVHWAVRKQLETYQHPRLTRDELLNRLERAGVSVFTQALRGER